MIAALRERAAAPRDEAGLTIIEVLVAALILAIGAAATFGILAAATKTAQRAKASQVTLDIAQEELEQLRSVPYKSLAIAKVPTASASPLNPDYRVQGTNFALKRDLTEPAPLVVNEAGVSSKSPFTSGSTSSGGITGTVYRYVVWRNDASCPDSQCPGQQDYKQIIVAVQAKAIGGQQQRGYVEVQSQRIDPTKIAEPEPGSGGEGGPGSGGGGNPNAAQQFYLSDTPCASSGTTIRQAIVSDHLLHNTLGTCASGLKTGSTPGAPDALLLASAPDPAPEDESNPALYDYSNDIYLEPNPDTDKGLQIRRDETEGCNYNPLGTTNRESLVHRWVTDRLTKAFSMTGEVTLEFYTRTLNDALYTGRLCVYLFDRSETGTTNPVATDTFLIDKETGKTFWTYYPGKNGFWPRNVWTKVRLPMELANAPVTLQTNHRLGVALSVEPVDTQGEAIPVMYDHPNFPSRLEVDTPTPISGS